MTNDEGPIVESVKASIGGTHLYGVDGLRRLPRFCFPHLVSCKIRLNEAGLIRAEIFLLIIVFLARSLEALDTERSGTVPFIFDDDRVFAELNFVRPNGTLRKALAFVDLGTPTLVLDKNLHEELQGGQGKPVILRVGDLEIKVDSSAVETDTGLGLTGRDGKRTLPVEAVLSGSVLTNYQVVVDYAKRTLTVA